MYVPVMIAASFSASPFSISFYYPETLPGIDTFSGWYLEPTLLRNWNGSRVPKDTLIRLAVEFTSAKCVSWVFEERKRLSVGYKFSAKCSRKNYVPNRWIQLTDLTTMLANKGLKWKRIERYLLLDSPNQYHEYLFRAMIHGDKSWWT